MTEEQITALFVETIQNKNASKVTGLSKANLYNYRNRKLPGLGTMLEMLISMNLVTVVKNESTGTT